MNPALMNPLVKDILLKYYPAIQSMLRELAMFTNDILTINTDCGSVTIKFKSYGINTESAG